jgi:hypothetical protein
MDFIMPAQQPISSGVKKWQNEALPKNWPELCGVGVVLSFI